MSNDGPQVIEGQLIERATFTESQAKGEVDMQVTTARRYPRSIKSFKERALSLATLDEETAAGCFYTLPARRGGNNKPIEGPSVRLAEIVAGSWGNIRAQAVITDDDGEFITAQGRCWDLETNVAISVDVRRRITDSQGRRYSTDMINTTANAACSVALRNAVFKVVPMAIVKPVYEQARLVAIGSAETLASRRAKMIEAFQKMGIASARVLASIERASVEDITLDDIGLLRGFYTAIKDGDSTIEEVFPEAEAKPSEKPKSKSDELAAKVKPATEKPFPDSMDLLESFGHRLENCETTSQLSDLYSDAKRDLSPDQLRRFTEHYETRRAIVKGGAK